VGHQTLLTPPRLLLITDCAGLDADALLSRARAALSGGVDAILLRAPGLDKAHVLALAASLRSCTREAHARLLIHSHADIARAVAADGVHVASRHIPQLPAMRRWLAEDGRGMSFSASCHNAAELATACACGADFALLSPVFPTRSHPEATPLGVAGFRRLASQAALPVVALGGIRPDNRHLLCGFGVAVIRAVLHADDPAAAARQLCASAAD